jgi:hypothetical protein
LKHEKESAVATVARFEIGHTRLIDPQGHVTQLLPAFAPEGAALAPMYRAMVLTRLFDAKAVPMHTGQLDTFASSPGAEAIGVGLASLMRPEDMLLPCYRDPQRSCCAPRFSRCDTDCVTAMPRADVSLIHFSY